MHTCPICDSTNYTEYAKQMNGAWGLYKKCQDCGADFDDTTVLDKRVENNNPFEETE